MITRDWVTWYESFSSEHEDSPTIQGDWFKVYRYNMKESKQIEKRKGMAQLEQIRRLILESDKLKPDATNRPFETIGELVQAMLSEAKGDAVKFGKVQKWADEIRHILTGNLWGYTYKQKVKETQKRLAQKTRQEPEPGPERKQAEGEDNLLTVADISRTGVTGKWE